MDSGARTPQHLDHAVRTGLITAGLVGVSIGIMFGLTHTTQVGAALTDAIEMYGDPASITFDTASPLIACLVSIIPAVVGGVAGAGAPIGGLILSRWLNPKPAIRLAAWLIIAISAAAGAGAIITSLVPQFAAEGAALGAGTGAVAGIVSLSSFHLQRGLWDAD